MGTLSHRDNLRWKVTRLIEFADVHTKLLVGREEKAKEKEKASEPEESASDAEPNEPSQQSEAASADGPLAALRHYQLLQPALAELSDLHFCVDKLALYVKHLFKRLAAPLQNFPKMTVALPRKN